MRWFNGFACLLFAITATAEDRVYLLGGGLEVDADNGLRGGVLAGLELGEDTWLSGAASVGSFELGNGDSGDLSYFDLDLDHFFDPFGVRVGAAYWGDPDLLDSNDWRASGYFRNERIFLGVDYEFRDFDFIIPPSDFFVGREFNFDAEGLGATIRIPLGEKASIAFSGMQYDYSVDFEPNDAANAARLISATRLSLLNELIDHRFSASLGFDAGAHRIELDYATWEGVIGLVRTNSYTIRYILPATARLDMECSLGFDESELDDGVVYASIYVFFFGGG